jgi:hypothetical protein
VRNKILLGPTAVLNNLDLSKVDLSGVDLSGAELDGARGSLITFDESTHLPSGWAIVNGYLMGPTAVLNDVYLSDANLDGVDLSAASLEGFIGKRLSGNPTLAKGYGIIRGDFVGEDVNLVCSDVLPNEISDAGLKTPTKSNSLLNSRLLAKNQKAMAPC